MKCNNCETEFDSKYCPDCGFPSKEDIKPKGKSKADEALELIKDTNARLRALEEDRAKRIKAKEDKDAKKERNTGKPKSAGILDIF